MVKLTVWDDSQRDAVAIMRGIVDSIQLISKSKRGRDYSQALNLARRVLLRVARAR